MAENDLITLAGLPATMQYSGIDFVTTELAPTIVPCPISTSGSIVTLSPIHTLSPITTRPLENTFLLFGGIFNSLKSHRPCEFCYRHHFSDKNNITNNNRI